MVDPKNIDMLANAMYKVLTDYSLKKEITEKGLNRVKLFSWKFCAVETLNVYEEFGN